MTDSDRKRWAFATDAMNAFSLALYRLAQQRGRCAVCGLVICEDGHDSRLRILS